MGKIEAIRHNVRDIVGTRARHRIAFVHIEGARAVVSRLTGAAVRAFLVRPSPAEVSITILRFSKATGYYLSIAI